MTISKIKDALRPLIPPRVLKGVRYLRRGDQRMRGNRFTYQQDGLATTHNCDFMSEARFAHAYALGKATKSWWQFDIHWRVHVACWCADRAMRLPGDFVECGVNKGGLARTVIEYVDFANSPKKFYLLDTFCGLSAKYVSQEESALGVDQIPYGECLEEVQTTFREFPNVEIIQGTVPDTLPQVATNQISYLSIDMNCVAPEIAAAEYFWDKLVSGGAILLDDYGWDGHINQKKAFDRFASDRSVPLLALPTGQGLILKP